MAEDEKGNANPENRLAGEKSPYLLQHAHNPVDWHPWSDEVFEKARREDKPIFVSIGYATCHWCHVMAHESFEDGEVAGLLNKFYVSVKVDREERPDIDQIYMSACQAMTGSGGWPLSVFITPEGKPFFAGTYFPKHSRMGITGFMELLDKIRSLWETDRERLLHAANEAVRVIQPQPALSAQGVELNLDTLRDGYSQLANSFDRLNGGFGHAPKFPTPHNLTFLLRWHKRSGDPEALAMVDKTLDAIRNGGIFDHLGLGLARYSVDEKWLVPHFEKMLYDQALVAIACIEAYQVSGNMRHARTAEEIFSYVLRDMTAPEGGFYSAEDADSEGKEGLFYVWTPDEINKILGAETGALFCRFYGVTDGGNFEDGLSVLHISESLEDFAVKEGMSAGDLDNKLAGARQKLFSEREKRVHPLKDDKILTSWNGLMIAALAKGCQALSNRKYLDAAERAAKFVLDKLKDPGGGLMRRYREGEVAHAAFLDDYAFLVWGLIELYEACFKTFYLEEALALNDRMLKLFWDEAAGGLFLSGEGNEKLVARSKEIYDGALPSGNSVAAVNLVRLGRITGETALEEKAELAAAAFAGQIAAHPIAYTHFLHALDFMLGPAREIVIAGDPKNETTRAMVEAVHRKFLPNKVLLLRDSGEDGERLSAISNFVEPLRALQDKATAYVCEQYACKRPITDVAELESALL